MARWNRHKTELRFGSQFGEEKFKASIISKVKTKEDEIYDLRIDVAVLLELVLGQMKIEKAKKY